MSYQKKNWQDLPNTTTPITATELNRMENGIADANGAIGADKYDSTATYAVNDLCIYNNTLYICTTAISTAEAWNSSHWEAISVDDMLISKTESNNVVTKLNKKIDFNCLNGVIERGSNANGEYVKFGDGTMICTYVTRVTNFAINRQYVSIYQGTYDWTFPVQFIGVPIVDCNIKYSSSASWSTVVDANATLATLRAYDVVSRPAGENTTIRAKAIGRWK